MIGFLGKDRESTGAQVRDPTHYLRQAGLPVSTGLHVLMLAGLVLFVHPAPLPQMEQVIQVELVSLPPAEPEPSGISPQDLLFATESEVTDVITAVETEMIEATDMLAGAALADPRNAEARAMLDLIVPSVRREQVCGIEAMEQIKAGMPDWSPECVISYAYEAVLIAGNAVTARGAVVQNGANWYRLDYECTLGADLASVTAFRYRIGDMVSAADTERLGLAPCM